MRRLPRTRRRRPPAAIDADGWLHTGDLGSMDERGYLRIAGRIKDMIIRGGENIYPREIEEVLISHPAVADASVLGFPDDHYGETVAAAIRVTGPDPAGDELGPDDLAAQLAEFCRVRLAAYKVPIRWLITGRLPPHRLRQGPQGRAPRAAGRAPAALTSRRPARPTGAGRRAPGAGRFLLLS